MINPESEMMFMLKPGVLTSILKAMEAEGDQIYYIFFKDAKGEKFLTNSIKLIREIENVICARFIRRYFVENIGVVLGTMGVAFHACNNDILNCNTAMVNTTLDDLIPIFELNLHHFL